MIRLTQSKVARFLRAMTLAIAVMAAVGAVQSTVMAADRIVLKNGTIIEGKIIREVDGYVWLEQTIGGIKKPAQMYKPADITKIERDADTTAKPAEATDAAAAPADKAPIENSDKAALPKGARPGVPRGVVITLGDKENGDMVGVFMVAKVLRDAIPTLERELGKDKTGIVVLRIHSGGGLGSEVQKISDVIQEEYKPRFRTVGWIETAISAAAMSAHVLEEIYFTSQGNYGACTGFYGSLDKPVEGMPLQLSLAQMERISARSNWNPLIMRAMQIQQPLSAKLNEQGRIEFFGDLTSGDFVVNREKEILTFTAETAERVQFSRGRADSLEELAHKMGYQEIDWIGDRMDKVPWPVSRAERIQMEYRRQVKEDQANTSRYFTELQSNMETARSMPRDRRPPFVGKARGALNQITRMVDNNPNFTFLVFNMDMPQFREMIERTDKELRDLLR